MIFKTFHRILSPPLLPDSLCCSKNKIPPVKLSALRFGAFKVEASQKLEGTWGTPTLASSTLSRPRLKCGAAPSLCKGAQSQLKMQIGVAAFFLVVLQDSNGNPNCWLVRGVCMLKVKEEGLWEQKKKVVLKMHRTCSVLVAGSSQVWMCGSVLNVGAGCCWREKKACSAKPSPG